MVIEIEIEIEIEECDICGRNCDGVHNIKINNKEKEKEKIINILESYDEKIVDEIIKQIYKNRHLNSEQV